MEHTTRAELIVFLRICRGTQTKTLLAETQGEIGKEHTRVFEVIFFSTPEADSTSGINAPQGGCIGVCFCAEV